MGNEQAQAHRQHVLVINGAAAFLEVVRELLEDEHYNVTTTNFVPRSFEMIAALQPDLLFIDLVVHQQAGWDLLDRLHQEASTHGIPILLTSTDPTLLARAQEEAERLGSHRVLAKPFEVAELLEAVEELIGTA